MKAYQDISRSETISLINLVGSENTILVEGETGIGKSAMLPELQRVNPNFTAYYCDLTTKDTGDIAMPKIKTIDGKDVCEFVPNAELGLHSDKPIILMWDELGKASKPVVNACLRVLLEGRLGSYKLPEGSIQFATTNLAAEGLGDNLQAHVRNRITKVTMRKPTASEWVEEFALENNIHPTIIQTVSEFPAMFGSFTQYQTAGENPYVYDPRSPLPAFVTPRSLEKGSNILHATETLSDSVRTHALMGCVGERAAMDIMSINALHAQLPRWEEIIDKPSKAKVPTQAGAMCMLVYTAIQNLEAGQVASWVTYMQRLRKEAQALFVSTSLRTSKAPTIAANKSFREWCDQHQYMYAK